MDINEELQGLLGIRPEDKQEALNMGLLQAGLGILARNTDRRNPFPAIAGGVQQGLQGYQGQMDRLKADKLQQLQNQELVRKLTVAKAQDKAKQDFLADPNIPSQIKQGVLAGIIDLADLAKPQKYGPDEAVVSPLLKIMGGDGVIAQGPKKAAKMGTEMIPIGSGMQRMYQTVDGVPDLTKPIGAARPIFKTSPDTVVQIPKAESAGAVELAKLDARQVDELRTQAQAAENALSNVQQMKQAVQGGVYSGTGASWRTQAANFFDTLGAPGVDPNKLSNSQQYEKYAKELTLAALKQAMGSTQISNTDREFVDATVPQLETNPNARLALLNFIESKSRKTISKFREADTLFREKGSLKGFGIGSESTGGWKDL